MLDLMDGTTLFVGLIIGLVGFGMYRYGRSVRRAPPVAGGFLMMVFPYFISNVAVTLLIAGVISGGTWWAMRMDL